jgi:hypothetical protein
MDIGSKKNLVFLYENNKIWKLTLVTACVHVLQK